jgi:hypothetical protein
VDRKWRFNFLKIICFRVKWVIRSRTAPPYEVGEVSDTADASLEFQKLSCYSFHADFCQT